MDKELEAMDTNHTWDIVPLPKDKKAISCKWIYKVKYNVDGTLAKRKARLIARGFTQEAGIDFLDTFSPVATITTVRVLLSLATIKQWNFIQLDVQNAFLNGYTDEEVYMKIPQGYKTPQNANGNLVCRLNRSLYGLKQASRQWFKHFSTSLKCHGFIQCTSDYYLFRYGEENNIVFLLVYVDDIILAGPNTDCLTSCQNILQNLFKLNVVGDLKFFLGLEIAKSKQGINLCQRKYIIQLLQDIGFLNAKSAVIPMDPNLHLTSIDGDLLPDPSAYRRLLGRLMYICISRPDIYFAVNKLSQFMNQPQTPHLLAVHQILCYLKANPGQGLLFSSQSSFTLNAYVDADWGSCLDSRKSTTGFCIFMGDSLLTWKSKKQPTVSRSSTEVEYRAIASITSELLWLKQLLRFFDHQPQKVLLLCDNVSAIHLSSNPVSHQRSKHIGIDVHFVREHVESGFLRLIHVKSHQQVADLFTKALPHQKFAPLISKLALQNIFAPT